MFINQLARDKTWFRALFMTFHTLCKSNVNKSIKCVDHFTTMLPWTKSSSKSLKPVEHPYSSGLLHNANWQGHNRDRNSEEEKIETRLLKYDFQSSNWHDSTCQAHHILRYENGCDRNMDSAKDNDYNLEHDPMNRSRSEMGSSQMMIIIQVLLVVKPGT